MRKIILIILIILSLLLGTLLVLEKIENKRLIEENEGLSDRLGEIEFGGREFK
jgi:hypothetical protein